MNRVSTRCCNDLDKANGLSVTGDHKRVEAKSFKGGLGGVFNVVNFYSRQKKP